MTDEPQLLIAEDKANIRNLLSVNLRARGYNVLLAEDGTEALAMIREHTPDLLLLDIAMPGLTGWDVLDELHKDDDGPKPPTIVITGHLEMQPYTGEYPHIVEVMTKPVVIADLLKLIKEVLDERHS